MANNQVIDPVIWAKRCWPHINLYDRQREILYSVRDVERTYVPAGHQLGKDFIAAVAALWWFISRRPSRVVTSSVQAAQLNDILWGEIRRLIKESRVELPIHYNHMRVRQVYEHAIGNGSPGNDSFVPRCEMVGRVVNKGESLFGRHLERHAVGPDGDGLNVPRILALFDEASGMDNTAYEGADTWANCHMLVIGNPYPCQNFFRQGVKEGQVKSPTGMHLRANVIKIKAEDSPNVKLALEQIKHGERKPTQLLVRTENRPWGVYTQEEYDTLLKRWNTSERSDPPLHTLVPGVLTFDKYLDNREFWDRVQQSIRLDAEFYEGAETLMYPPEWLNIAERIAAGLPKHRAAIAVGVDPAEGGNSTALAAADTKGIIQVESHKTPDTAKIPGLVLEFARRYSCQTNKIYFDRGGGGYQIACFMRDMGYSVKTVGFGERIKAPIKTGISLLEERRDLQEEQYTYTWRRDEMYGRLREKLDPAYGGYGIPEHLKELRRQLAPIPYTLDGEGRLRMLPKRNNDPNSTKPDLVSLIGCSPDEADAAVLAMHGVFSKELARTVGVF